MNTFLKAVFIVGLSCSCLFGQSQQDKIPFGDLVGNVSVGEVSRGRQVQVPVILWGGDVPLFLANGGITTRPGSIYAKLGLDIKFVVRDDYPLQIREYVTGVSPLIRVTSDMGAMASEFLSRDPRTKPIMLFKMTNSLGDHFVGRAHIKSIKDFKGATICIARGAPHEGFLHRVLKDGTLSWDDINVIWTEAKDFAGLEGNAPGALFRKNSNIDICGVITPDMFGLTGAEDIHGVGTHDSPEGMVKGAHVVVSTQDRPQSIHDGFEGRKDWIDQNPDWIEKFTAGYLKGCEETLSLKKKYESTGSQEYLDLLNMVQEIYGVDLIPVPEIDAHGLILDCEYMLHPGNVEYFGSSQDQFTGFDAMMRTGLDFAVERGYASVRQAIIPSTINWNSSVFDFLKVKKASKKQRFDTVKAQEYVESLGGTDLMDDNTIYTVVINFDENQTEFSPLQYSSEFKKVVELSAQYSNSIFAIRGHADPKFFLQAVVYCGKERNIIDRRGSPGNYKYFVNRKELDITSIKEISELIQGGKLDGVVHPKVGMLSPSQMYQGAKSLAKTRSQNVLKAILDFAKISMNNYQIDISQIQPVGVGFDEPLNPLPRTSQEQLENMRVEFSLVRVKAEVLNDTSFDEL